MKHLQAFQRYLKDLQCLGYCGCLSHLATTRRCRAASAVLPITPLSARPAISSISNSTLSTSRLLIGCPLPSCYLSNKKLQLRFLWCGKTLRPLKVTPCSGRPLGNVSDLERLQVSGITNVYFSRRSVFIEQLLYCYTSFALNSKLLLSSFNQFPILKIYFLLFVKE